jgi:hypothetical protein
VRERQLPGVTRRYPALPGAGDLVVRERQFPGVTRRYPALPGVGDLVERERQLPGVTRRWGLGHGEPSATRRYRTLLGVEDLVMIHVARRYSTLRIRSLCFFHRFITATSYRLRVTKVANRVTSVATMRKEHFSLEIQCRIFFRDDDAVGRSDDDVDTLQS